MVVVAYLQNSKRPGVTIAGAALGASLSMASNYILSIINRIDSSRNVIVCNCILCNIIINYRETIMGNDNRMNLLSIYTVTVIPHRSAHLVAAYGCCKHYKQSGLWSATPSEETAVLGNCVAAATTLNWIRRVKV